MTSVALRLYVWFALAFGGGGVLGSGFGDGGEGCGADFGIFAGEGRPLGRKWVDVVVAAARSLRGRSFTGSGRGVCCWVK